MGVDGQHEHPSPDPPLADQSLPSEHLTPIQVDLRRRLSSFTIQVNAPHKIDTELLHPFSSRIRPLLLVDVVHRQRLSAIWHAATDTVLIVDTDEPTTRFAQGHPLVICFPVLPLRHYVIQATIEEVFAYRLSLRYRDPRYDIRRRLPVDLPVTIHRLPEAIVGALEDRQLHLVRALSVPQAPTQTRGSVVDQVWEGEGAEHRRMELVWQDTTVLSGYLRDISLGGMAVTLDATEPPITWGQGVIRLHIVLPASMAHPPDQGYAPLTLDLFGILRAIEAAGPPWILHIRLLERLPAICESYMAEELV
jgi:hypothetical protein